MIHLYRFKFSFLYTVQISTQLARIGHGRWYKAKYNIYLYLNYSRVINQISLEITEFRFRNIEVNFEKNPAYSLAVWVLVCSHEAVKMCWQVSKSSLKGVLRRKCKISWLLQWNDASWQADRMCFVAVNSKNVPKELAKTTPAIKRSNKESQSYCGKMMLCLPYGWTRSP